MDPWSFLKKKRKRPMTIAEALESERSDLNVSEWLQRVKANVPESKLPLEVLAAFNVDRFVQEVNSGGFLGFFDWEFDEIGRTMDALRAIALPEVADLIGQAIQLVSGADVFESRDRYDQLKEGFLDDERRSAQMNKLDDRAMSQSAAIESRTHEYVQANIAKFQSFDP